MRSEPPIARPAPAPAAARVVGAEVTAHDERNGYVFWGLVAAFIAVPELLAAFSQTLKADIPWPTISNLVGKDLEAHHHWFALVVVGLITAVAVHTLTYPSGKKKAGRAMRSDATGARHVAWGGKYVFAVAGAGIAAGLIAAAAGADKNQLGYAIYLTLVIGGVAVPGVLAYFGNRALATPTLFATIAYLRMREAWAAAFVIALLVVLTFHLALYPWPNYRFGSP